MFFSEFPIVLYEWLAQLTFQKKYFHGGKLNQWTTKIIIHHLGKVNNKSSRFVDVCIDNILEGYIIDFVVDTIKYYNDVE